MRCRIKEVEEEAREARAGERSERAARAAEVQALVDQHAAAMSSLRKALEGGASDAHEEANRLRSMVRDAAMSCTLPETGDGPM